MKIKIPYAQLRLSTIIWLTKPFKIFKFSSERFAVRIYLIIDLVEKIPSIINSKKSLSHNQSKIKTIIASMKNLNTVVFYHAENDKTEQIRYQEKQFPWNFEWLYLIFCFSLFYFIDLEIIVLF